MPFRRIHNALSASFPTYVQKCMQWRKWRKIASLWRFELDAKSGPLETGDFGENGDCSENSDFGENRQRAGGIQNMWRIFKLDAKSGPFKLDNLRRPCNCEATLLKKRSNYIPISFEFLFIIWRSFPPFSPNTLFSPKTPLSKGPLCHLSWIFVYNLAILAINFCHFRQICHFRGQELSASMLFKISLKYILLIRSVVKGKQDTCFSVDQRIRHSTTL